MTLWELKVLGIVNKMEPTQTDKFEATMCSLCDNIKGMVTDVYEIGHKRIHPNLMDAVKAYLLDKEIHAVIEKFVEGSVEFWEQLRAHDEEFFVKNVSKVFGTLPYPDEIAEFSRLFLLRDIDGERMLAKEDRDIIWEHFDSMIRICIVYIHQGRHPRIKKPDSNGTSKAVYTKNFFPKIKLAELARLWEMKLEW